MRHLILVIMTIGSLNAQDLSQYLMEQHTSFEETSLKHRRFKHGDLLRLIENLPEKGFEVVEVGRSYQDRPIFHISIGTGTTSVFLWSQMHGNEATATMASFDIFNYLGRNESPAVQQLLSRLTLHFIPMLNPDGAELFERRTSQGIDMNRDALKLEGPESKILKSTRDSLTADFGFNLHDQNIYYNVGTTEKPATISFLAPAYNEEKEANSKREDAMKVIAVMNEALQSIVPGQVGKYDDTFEPRAFGDNIQKWGTRTILIESGGYPDDPEKQFIRKLNFVAILTAMHSIAASDFKDRDTKEYWDIPLNRSNLNDVLIKNIQVQGKSNPYEADIAIRREESDIMGSNPVFYKGTIEDLGDLTTQYGYQEIDAKGLTYAPGKTYPGVLKGQQEVIALGVSDLLQQGYTYFRLEQQQQPGGNALPFDLIKSEVEPPAQPKIDQPATFLLLKNGAVKYAVINGFVYDVEEPNGTTSQGWVY